ETEQLVLHARNGDDLLRPSGVTLAFCEHLERAGWRQSGRVFVRHFVRRFMIDVFEKIFAFAAECFRIRANVLLANRSRYTGLVIADALRADLHAASEVAAVEFLCAAHLAQRAFLQLPRHSRNSFRTPIPPGTFSELIARIRPVVNGLGNFPQVGSGPTYM